MKIASLQKFRFNIAEGFDTHVIRFNSDEVGDDVVPEVYIECTDLPEESQINAIGYTLKDSDGISLKFADIANLGTVDSIDKDGIYLILSSALERLELVTNADANIVIKQVI